ncbi:MAG TPA: O-antigen ligase family protein [Ktedonobacteraceae bacterium]|nr:O-antigen ligase family protein [Ktedonobacteraceae bacterium]
MNGRAMNQAAQEKNAFQQWRHVLADYCEWPVSSWRQVALLIVFALLLVLVVAGCTGNFSPFVTVALLGCLTIAAVAVARPQLALWLIFLGAGLPSLLVPLPGHTLRPIEGALVLALAIVILRRPTMRFRLPHLLMLLFLLIALISFIHVPARSSGLDSYGADKRLFDVSLLVIAFFCGTLLMNYVKDISGFFSIALLCNLPFCLIGLAQWLGIHMPALLVPSQAVEVLQEGRLSGPADSPTTFAFYLINLFCLALACWLLGTRRRDRVIGAMMTIVTAISLIGSGTRSAVGAALLVVIVALLINRRLRLLLLAAFLVGIAGIFFSGQILGKFTHDPYSISNRLLLWQDALKLIWSNPWIGIGMQQFPVYYAKLTVGLAARLNPAGISVHNQYLELALESGMSWLLIALCLLISIVFACWKVYRIARRRHQLLLLATIGMILANLVISMVDVPLDKPEGGVILFLVAGLALGCVELIRKGGNAESAARSGGSIPFSQLPAISPTGVGGGLYEAGRYLPTPGRLRSYQTTMPLPKLVLPKEENSAAPSARKSSFSVIIQLISWGIAIPIIFPTTALLTHYLQPVQYGEYSFTLPFLAICALGTFTGMDPLLVRRLSRQKRSAWNSTLSQTAGARLCTTIVVSLIAACVAFLLPVSAEQRILLWLGIGTLIFSYSFNCVRGVYESGFMAEQNVAVVALLSTLNRVMTAALIVVAVLSRLPLIQTYILIAYSDLPFFLVLVLLARKRFQMRIHISLPYIRQVLRESFAITGHDALALFSGQIDLLLLLPLAGPLSVGIYALAMRITDPLLNLAFAYVNGLFPFLCTKFEQGRAEFAALYREATRLMALAIIPLAIFVSVEAPAIIGLLGGERFVAAVPATRLLMWSITLSFFGCLALQTNMAANQERRIPYITAISLCTNILANVLLIPLWQTTGAALAALLCELVGLCLFSLLLVRHVQLSAIVLVIFQVVLGNVPGMLFLLWQQNMPMFYLVPAFGLITIAGCFATHALSLKDIEVARRLLVARRGKYASNQADKEGDLYAKYQ